MSAMEEDKSAGKQPFFQSGLQQAVNESCIFQKPARQKDQDMKIWKSTFPSKFA